MATTRDEAQQQPLHMLFLPYFALGHLIPVTDMAGLFAARGARCTILTTPINANIIRPAVDRANAANLHGAIVISILPFPDVGLPPGMENLKSVTPSHGAEYHVKFVQATQLLREPFDRFLATTRPRVDAVVSDSFFPWSTDSAAAHGVPRLVFLGSSVFARSCSETMLRNSPLETANYPDDPDTLTERRRDAKKPSRAAAIAKSRFGRQKSLFRHPAGRGIAPGVISTAVSTAIFTAIAVSMMRRE